MAEWISFVSKSLIKNFPGHGDFEGTVRKYIKSRDVYKVVYTDGDCEELPYLTMKNLVDEMLQTSTATAQTKAAAAPATASATTKAAAGCCHAHQGCRRTRQGLFYV